MIIKWYGECSFSIKVNSNFEIYTDPIDDIFTSNSKVVTISHTYPGLSINFSDSNNCTVIDKAIAYTSESLTIDGYNSYHDDMKGKKRGTNIIYKFNINNLTLCHLGHLGHMLDDPIISELGSIDILFVPIGGNLTINSIAATKLINKINPKIIIPMFYSTAISMTYIDTLKNFLVLNKSVTKDYTYTFNTDTIKKYKNKTILILKKYNFTS